MLVEIRIGQLGLVEDMSLELGPGLSVLTGETGAGKSMIASALALLAGGRAAVDLVRDGSEDAFVEGLCDISGRPHLRRLLGEIGIRSSSDDLLVLRREIRRQGRSRVLINGLASPLALLERIGPHLLAVQSQDQQRELGESDFARRYLDQRLGLTDEVAELAAALASHDGLQGKLRRRVEEEQAAHEQMDLWSYQHRELEQAGLREDEPAELSEALAILRHADVLQSGAAAALDLVSEGQNPAREVMGAALRQLAPLVDKSARLSAAREKLWQAGELLAEVARELESFLASSDLDPSRLAEMEERHALYAELQRKYGLDVAGLISLRDRLDERIHRQAQAAEDLRRLERDLDAARDTVQTAAGRLHEARVLGAPRVSRAARELIRPLGLPSLALEFVVDLVEQGDSVFSIDGKPVRIGRAGASRVRLLFQTNPGEKSGEAAQIASGGEKSRLYIGLAALAAADLDERPLMLFDEIDAGLGMDSAAPLAGLLERLALAGQVIAITHLPTLAVRGRQHLVAVKSVSGGRTRLQVSAVRGQARVAEIARLLGGESAAAADAAQVAYAQQLLAAYADDAHSAAENAG